MKFYFKDKTKNSKASDFKRIARKVFKNLKITDKIELGLKITDNRETKKLNQKYRGVNQATDVLSFPVDFPDKKVKKENLMLGDIIISVDKAKEYSRQACLETSPSSVEARKRENKKTTEEELIELFKHGLLHLLGYDHKKNKKKWHDAELKIVNC